MFYRFASNVRYNLLERCDLARVKFLSFLACNRLFLYTAVKFWLFFAVRSTFSLRGCKVSVGIVCV